MNQTKAQTNPKLFFGKSVEKSQMRFCRRGLKTVEHSLKPELIAQ